MFTEDTLGKFGSSYSCAIDAEKKVITVTLDTIRSTLKKETITLKPYNFWTAENIDCAQQKQPQGLNPQVSGKSVKLTSIIAAPLYFSTACSEKDLFVDGRESFGNFGRTL
jgi:hypothetical protein